MTRFIERARVRPLPSLVFGEGVSMERIGHKIKRYRKRRDWTQVALAKAVGLDHRRISEWERGREWPQAFDLSKVADAFGIAIATLIKGTDWGSESRVSGFSRVFSSPRWKPSKSRVGESAQRFYRARLDFPELTRRLDQAIDESPHKESARLGETLLPLLSSREALLCLHLFAARGWVESLAPQLCGYISKPVIDPESKAVVGAIPLPALGVYLGAVPHLLFPNISIACGPSYFTLDFLVGVKKNRGVEWKNLEVDGEGHDSTGDRERARALGLPQCRVNVEQLQRHDFPVMLAALLSG